MPSSCMQRRWSCRASFCSGSTAPTSLAVEGSLGKMATPSARRSTSPLARAGGLAELISARCRAGEPTQASPSAAAPPFRAASLGTQGRRWTAPPAAARTRPAGLGEGRADPGWDDAPPGPAA